MPEDTTREKAAGEVPQEEKGGQAGGSGGGDMAGGARGEKGGDAAAAGGAAAQDGSIPSVPPSATKDPAADAPKKAADPPPPVSTVSHREERRGGGGVAARPGGVREPKKYTFFVGPGNNSELVRATLERRPWWVLGKEDDPELNLKWLQVRNRTVAEYVRRMGSKQFLNHLEGLTCIGRKNELYANLKAYCERERINIHEIAPPTFIITVGDNCAEYFEFSRVCKQLESRSIARFAPVKAVKNAVSTVSAMQAAVAATKAAPKDAPDAAPGGAVVGGGGNNPPDDAAPAPQGTDAESVANAAGTAEAAPSAPGTVHATPAPSEAPSEAGGDAPAPASPAKSPTKGASAKALLKGGGGGTPTKAGRMSRADAISSTTTAGDRNIWIVKPTNNNRGNGIRVFKSFAQIDEHLKKKSQGSAVVVQKYIERPLLYKRRKFDVRVLVLVDPQMQVFVYRDAYCRTSTQEYSLDNINDLFIHLTNYAVQKKNKKGSKVLDEDELDEDETMEEGNNLSMDELSVFLKELDPNGPDASDIMDKIKRIVVTTFHAVWRKLNPQREHNTFEVFGWDFLLDEEMNTWLIEVNTNPYIGCSSSLLRTIFTGMLEGLARRCIDPYFPPPPGMKGLSLPEVEGADLWERVLPERDAPPPRRAPNA